MYKYCSNMKRQEAKLLLIFFIYPKILQPPTQINKNRQISLTLCTDNVGVGDSKKAKIPLCNIKMVLNEVGTLKRKSLCSPERLKAFLLLLRYPSFSTASNLNLFSLPQYIF